MRRARLDPSGPEAIRPLFRCLVSISLLAAISTPDLWAQVRGIPVLNGEVRPGIEVGGTVGFPNGALGGGTAYAATSLLGIGRIGLSASVAEDDRSGGQSSIGSFGGTLSWKAIGNPAVPYSFMLQAGYGHWKADGLAVSHVPLGIGIGVTIPIPVLEVGLWLAPRLDLSSTSSGAGSSTVADFAISGGLTLSLLSGLGFRFSYDRVSAAGNDPAVFAVGAHYLFKVRGL